MVTWVRSASDFSRARSLFSSAAAFAWLMSRTT
jgi:hypothetical protein